MADAARPIRPLQPAELPAAIRLVESEAQSNEWLEPIPEMLEEAARGDGRERRAICVSDGDDIVGLGVYGFITGTEGTATIDAIVIAPDVRGKGLGSGIARYIREDVRAAGGRLMIAELPSDPAISEYRAVLWGCGFRQESRIEDYYRDGMSLLQLRLEL